MKKVAKKENQYKTLKRGHQTTTPQKQQHDCFETSEKGILHDLTRVSSTREFASQDEALAFLIESVVGYVDDTKSGAELSEFLQTLIDTNPELKEDLLQGVKVSPH